MVKPLRLSFGSNRNRKWRRFDEHDAGWSLQQEAVGLKIRSSHSSKRSAELWWSPRLRGCKVVPLFSVRSVVFQARPSLSLCAGRILFYALHRPCLVNKATVTLVTGLTHPLRGVFLWFLLARMISDLRRSYALCGAWLLSILRRTISATWWFRQHPQCDVRCLRLSLSSGMRWLVTSGSDGGFEGLPTGKSAPAGPLLA